MYFALLYGYANFLDVHIADEVEKFEQTTQARGTIDRIQDREHPKQSFELTVSFSMAYVRSSYALFCSTVCHDAGHYVRHYAGLFCASIVPSTLFNCLPSHPNLLGIPIVCYSVYHGFDIFFLSFDLTFTSPTYE